VRRRSAPNPMPTLFKQYLTNFHAIADFEKSVFVMTKFPEPASQAAIDLQLRAVIQAVIDAVRDCGYRARLANEQRFHAGLWDNVELYLLGSRRGIAIVENKYLDELNPNVAMEWGWMRGMGRDVLYLVEKDFGRARADWNGFIQDSFDWAHPVPDIAAAVRRWLTPAATSST
jgi:hypothetical protein